MMSANLQKRSSLSGRVLLDIDLSLVRTLLPTTPVARIAKTLGVHRNTIYYHLKYSEEIRRAREDVIAKRQKEKAVPHGATICNPLLPAVKPLSIRLPYRRKIFGLAQMLSVEAVMKSQRCSVKSAARELDLSYDGLIDAINRTPQFAEIIRRARIAQQVERARARLCGKCGTVKPISEFYKTSGRDGYRSFCVPCYRNRSIEMWHSTGKFHRVRRGRRVTPLSSCYPYRIDNGAAGADLITAINNLVPRSLPELLRADVCQALALAVLSGEIEADKISPHVQRFIKEQNKFLPRKHELSLDAPLYRDGDKFSLLDTISAEQYTDAWSTARVTGRNFYGGSLSDCEGTEDYAERLLDAWEANRLKTNRKSYSEFHADHRDDNRKIAAASQSSGHAGMYINVRRKFKPSTSRAGVEKKLDEQYWATEDYLEQRIAEEREALNANA